MQKCNAKEVELRRHNQRSAVRVSVEEGGKWWLEVTSSCWSWALAVSSNTSTLDSSRSRAASSSYVHSTAFSLNCSAQM